MAVAAGGIPAEIVTGDTVHVAGGLAVDYLTGVFVKSVTAAGAVILQDADGAEQAVQIVVGSGAAVTSGTADPTGGAAGDAYLQVNASAVLQSIWRNVAGTWTEYTFPTGDADGTVLNGNGAPAGNSGKNGDTYRDDETGAWYKKASGAWSAALYTPGDGATLSDDDPLNVTGAPSSGTGSEASRDTHRHALTHRDRGRVDSVDGLKAITHDLAQTNTARAWVDSTTAGFAVFDGEPSEADLTGATYTNGATLPTALPRQRRQTTSAREQRRMTMHGIIVPDWYWVGKPRYRAWLVNSSIKPRMAGLTTIWRSCSSATQLRSLCSTTNCPEARRITAVRLRPARFPSTTPCKSMHRINWASTSRMLLKLYRKASGTGP